MTTANAAVALSLARRLHHLADCWRRLAEADAFEQKSFRLAWADHLDCLARREAESGTAAPHNTA
jgi:hypothetical protein